MENPQGKIKDLFILNKQSTDIVPAGVWMDVEIQAILGVWGSGDSYL
jgi:hypothetical protein